jgi:MFS family permease
MLNQFSRARGLYPAQFWWLLWGSLLSATGSALIWPFLSIYLRQRLGVPLTTVAGLLTLNAIAGLLSALIAGPCADRFGRKGVMVLSLGAGVLYYLLMTRVSTLGEYALLIGAWGAFSPLYTVGANAMVADLVPAERRTDAYALLRVVHNIGVAIGPIIGGFMAAISYASAFYAAALAFAAFTVLVLWRTKETLPRQTAPSAGSRVTFGLAPVLRDRRFVAFVASFGMTLMAAAIMFLLLPVYTKENYALPESRYGFIVTVNALMCIFLQYGVTQVSRRFSPLPVLAVGAAFYGLGVGSVAWGQSFAFWCLSMAVMTLGELLMMPTATALAANLAPPEMRGRYMSVYNLTWGLGAGTGPLLGGLLNDSFGPRAMWYGAAAFALLSALWFAALVPRFRPAGSRP